MNLKLSSMLIIAATVLAGCAANLEYAKSQGITQVSPIVFEVFREDHRGIFGSESSLQNEVVSEANDFAEHQGLVAAPLEARQHRVGILGDWAWCYYKFQLVSKGDLKLGKKASELIFEADARMSNNFLNSKNAIAIAPTTAKKNPYDELLKLDELRQKGILTEEEFQTQKKRLLE